MVTPESDMTSRAIRRESAIEKHRETIIEYVKQYEELVEKLTEMHRKKWRGLPDDLLILQNFVIELEMATSQAQREQYNSRLFNFVSELMNKYPAFPAEDDLFSRLRSMRFVWDNLLIWLEITTEGIERRMEEVATDLKIPYDKDEPLWVQKYTRLGSVPGRNGPRKSKPKVARPPMPTRAIVEMPMQALPKSQRPTMRAPDAGDSARFTSFSLTSGLYSLSSRVPAPPSRR